MNCNCCNCSSNSGCGDNSEIKIYGTLVNVTLDNTLDDANCNADNKDYDTGHNDAIVYAYQIHDGRFRADDKDLPEHERFQDAINRRITNITFDPDTNTTNIEGNVTINGDEIGAYDDAWLKDIIGTTPEGEQAASDDLQDDFPGQESGDIISYIKLLKAKIDDLQRQINQLTPQPENTCYWEVDSDGYLQPNNTEIRKTPCGCDCQGVRGPGFYDTTVLNP